MYKSQKKSFAEFLSNTKLDLSFGYHRILKDIQIGAFKLEFLEKVKGKIVSFDKYPNEIHVEYKYQKNFVQTFFDIEKIVIVVEEDDKNAIQIAYTSDMGYLRETDELYGIILSTFNTINDAF